MAVADLETPFLPNLSPHPPDHDSAARATIQQILVPLDGSRYAEAALTLAGEFAMRTGASVTVVHAVTPRDVPDVDRAAELEQQTLDGRFILASAAGRLSQIGVPVEELLVLPHKGD